MNQYYKNCITILNNCLKQKISIPDSCKKSGRSKDYVSTFCKRIEERIKNKQISKEEAETLINLYEQVKENKFSKDKKTNKTNKKLSIIDKLSIENEIFSQDEIEEINYDAFSDEKYEDRSNSEIIRDNSKKIVSYKFKIYIRDEKTLEGTFTREEMDLVYRLYSNMDGAGMTLRAVSRHFKNLTFRDFKRILRAFNITKSSIPVAPHIIEESSENEVMDIIFRNKENNILKKLEEERGRYVEKNLKDAHKLIIEYKNNEDWIENIINKYIDNSLIKNSFIKYDKKTNIKNEKRSGKPLFVFFGDIHYGKKYNNPIYGRGYNKEIAHERIIEIKNKVIEEFKLNNNKEIVLVNLGDLVESVLEDGMHPNHTAEMDLFQEEQIFYAIDSLKFLLIEIYNNTSCPIEFHSIHGNHDRVGLSRDQDRNRTAGKIISHVLKRELENERIKFFIPKNNLCKIVKDNICVFAQHGDSSLSKKKPSELVNLYGEPGCFTILIQGHWHSLRSEEGTNFIAMKVPSVASSDKFVLEELGNNNLPGFIIGKQPDLGYGFDFKKITLY